MAMGRGDGRDQDDLWIATQDLARAPGHVFYEKLNEVLAAHGFDRFVEGLCAPFYAKKMGRPSIAPGVYFRMLLVGYFEGIDSERGIAWRCADSLNLRKFLGYPLDRKTPDHSTVSRTRRLIDEQTHREVFTFVLKMLGKDGLIRGKTIGVDASTLEANAALRSIVRRDTGEGYEGYLKGLAKASGIEEPTREDLAKLDKKRKKKGSNKEWRHPWDPEARITKMKDGRTHLAHKVEHAVDLEGEGAVVGLTVQGADRGDTTTLYGTILEVSEQMSALSEDSKAAEEIDEDWLREVVLDKGYHSSPILVDLEEMEIRGYVSEPDRGRRRWKTKKEHKFREQDAVYANRRRVRAGRGKRLLKKRGELLERPFAHYLDTGGMRRLHLRGQSNILKRLIVHVCGFNLGLLMRGMLGQGTPRGLADLLRPCSLLLRALRQSGQCLFGFAESWAARVLRQSQSPAIHRAAPMTTSTTGC
jgi:transposase